MPKPAYLSVKNFERYQHYKNRNPPWVKLYNSLLDDYTFTSLPEKSRYHYLALLLLASRLGNQIPYETNYLCRMLHIEEADLTPLIDAGFLLADRKHRASKSLAPCKQVAMPEESREERETEERRESPASAGLGVDQVVTDWNLIAGVKPMQEVTGPVRERIRVRLKEHPQPEWWATFFAKVAASDFLCGRKTDFAATLDWVLGPRNLSKILAGNYDNHQTAGKETHGKTQLPYGGFGSKNYREGIF